jgi:hypothetical protein
MGAIAQSLADGLKPETLRLNMTVKRIVYHPNGVKLEVVEASGHGTSTSEDTESKNSDAEVNGRTRYERRAKSNRHAIAEDIISLSADVCIVTVPLGVLKSKSIAFCPDLPREKKTAIENLGFGVLNKVALLFPFKFWSDDCEIFGWCSDKRGDMPIFVDMSHDGYPILSILVSGTPAEKVEAESFKSISENGEDVQGTLKPIVKRATDILKKIFKDVPPVLEAKVSRWRSDIFAHGSYSFVACESSPSDYDVIAAPVSSSRGGAPRLFFAGEATNRLFPASVHGAFFSGVREAKRVNKWYPLVKTKGSRNEPPVAGEDRLCRLRGVKELTNVPEDVYWEWYAPPFTFQQAQRATRGKIILSKSSVPTTVSKGGLPSSPRAGGKRGRGLNATGAASTSSISMSPFAKRAKLSLENISQGDRLQISWKNGKFYDAWVSTLTRSRNGSVQAGVYYDDGSFEVVDLTKEKWRPC